MFNELKKAALVGVGGTALTVEKTVDQIDRLVEKGKLSVDEGKHLTRELIKRKDKNEDITEQDREQLQALLIDMNVAQRKDIEELEEKVNRLEAKLDSNNSKTTK